MASKDAGVGVWAKGQIAIAGKTMMLAPASVPKALRKDSRAALRLA
jgi:hypothetical protein